MFTSKSFALVLCGMAACLFVAEESQAQSGKKAGSSTSRSRSSQGSDKKPAKVTGRLSGALSATAMMTVFDSNGDDVVSKKEVSNFLLLLTALDANTDGRITAEEMSETSIMAVAPRFEEDKKRAMAKKMEMEAGSQSKPEMKEEGSASR